MVSAALSVEELTMCDLRVSLGGNLKKNFEQSSPWGRLPGDDAAFGTAADDRLS